MDSSELWNTESLRQEVGNGTYVAISGNTSAGKSSIIRHVLSSATDRVRAVIGVSEREFHHPYLPLMFSQPERYAFGIQLQFLMQRHLVLRRHLQLGRTVVMERSHLDDALFVQEHTRAGKISREQLAAYQHLAQVLHSDTALPDVWVLLNPPPDVSLRRLEQAEQAGERPREFPDDAAKRQWVFRWYDLYEEFHAEIRRKVRSEGTFARATLVDAHFEAPVKEVAQLVVDALVARDPSGMARKQLGSVNGEA